MLQPSPELIQDMRKTCTAHSIDLCENDFMTLCQFIAGTGTMPPHSTTDTEAWLLAVLKIVSKLLKKELTKASP